MLIQLDPKPGSPPNIEPALRDKLIKQGLLFLQGFIDEDNPDPAVRYQSGQVYEEMSAIYCSQHDIGHCRAMMDKACVLLEGLIAEFPNRDAYRRKLIRCRYLMGLFYKSLGQPRPASEQYSRAIQLCRLTAKLDVSAETKNVCAYLLVDCPDEALRDPVLAATLAEEAVKREPQRRAFWNTLGVARYRAGQWTKARSDLEKSMALSHGGDPYDWFFLALISHRLGDAATARVWRNKAVRWMEERQSQAEDLVRYRKEADNLIGP
jgi:tetratricopeptide (TPR) repeat protein